MTVTFPKPTLLCCLALLLSLPRMATAETYVEETYDDLVQRLNQQRGRVQQQTVNQLEPNPLDDITLHAGAGLVASTFNLSQNGLSRQFAMNGFQLTAGVDLFTKSMVAEGALRNFGEQSAGSQNYSFRELDLKTFYRQPSQGNEIGYRIGAGLATRYLTFHDGILNIEETNPAMIGFVAIESTFQQKFGVVLELGYRSVLVSHVADQNSADLTLRFDGFF